MYWCSDSNGITSMRGRLPRSCVGIDADLLRGHHQRGFGGVAGDAPALAFALQAGVVTERACLEQARTSSGASLSSVPSRLSAPRGS